MRTGLIVSMVILAIVVVLGIFSQQLIVAEGNRYESAAQELLTLCSDGLWDETLALARSYRDRWDGTAHWMRMLLHHDDVDAIALSLSEIQAGALSQSLSSSVLGCYHLANAAQRMVAHDRMNLENLL